MDDAGDGEEDEASAVVNALVASVVAPRLEKLARESFDPMSRRQTTRALALLEEVEYSVERSSPKFVVSLSFISLFRGSTDVECVAVSRRGFPWAYPARSDSITVPRRPPPRVHRPPLQCIRPLDVHRPHALRPPSTQAVAEQHAMEEVREERQAASRRWNRSGRDAGGAAREGTRRQGGPARRRSGVGDRWGGGRETGTSRGRSVRFEMLLTLYRRSSRCCPRTTFRQR